MVSRPSQKLTLPTSEQAPAPLRPLWTEKQLAAYLNVSLRKIQYDRQFGVGVPFIKIGKSIRYRPEAAEAYLREQERRSTTVSQAA